MTRSTSHFRAPIVGALLLALVLGACNRDEQVLSDLEVFDSFTRELVATVELAADPAAGINAANELLASKKDDLNAAMERISAIRGFQVSDEIKEKVGSSMASNVAAVHGLQISLFRQVAMNEELEPKLDDLIDAYDELLMSARSTQEAG